MGEPLLDARGVEISPGDTVIYGFGVSRSVAMAEGVVLGEPESEVASTSKVSLTATGLVRIRVVRRSYASGSKPVVNLMPDRIVVLKPCVEGLLGGRPELPPSPLPTQDEAYRVKLEGEIAQHEANLQLTEVPDWWKVRGDTSLEGYRAHQRKWLAESRKKLEALDG
jgi:hypothetical protein